MEALLSVVYIVLLVTAGMAGGGLLRSQPPRLPRPPFATMAALVLTAVPSLVQLTVTPGLYETLRRDRAAIGDGELWRLLTSFAVQDSGWPGLIFNVIALAVIGTLAERLWGTARWLVLAVTVQVLGNLWGLVVQPVGAGTSLVNYGLAASLAAASVVLGTGPRLRVPAAVSLLAALLLLALTDIHGGAALLGALAGATLAAGRRRAAVG